MTCRALGTLGDASIGSGYLGRSNRRSWFTRGWWHIWYRRVSVTEVDDMRSDGRGVWMREKTEKEPASNQGGKHLKTCGAAGAWPGAERLPCTRGVWGRGVAQLTTRPGRRRRRWLPTMLGGQPVQPEDGRRSGRAVGPAPGRGKNWRSEGESVRVTVQTSHRLSSEHRLPDVNCPRPRLPPRARTPSYHHLPPSHLRTLSSSSQLARSPWPRTAAYLHPSRVNASIYAYSRSQPRTPRPPSRPASPQSTSASTAYKRSVTPHPAPPDGR